MKLPRSAIWKLLPWNCQGWQFENINLVMDRANGWKAAMKLPRSAVWGPKGPKGWKLAMKLPRSAVWERGRETAKVGSLSPQKKVWFKLPTLAVLWPLFQTARYGRFAQVFSRLCQYVVFFAHAHMHNAAYISSITWNSISGLDSW